MSHGSGWEERIRDEAQKLIVRFESYARQLSDEQKRRARRTIAVVSPLEKRRPAYWQKANGFDPFLVRANASRIARAIQMSIRARTYAPRTAVVYQVPKPGGGLRDVSVFQVADNAVSRRIFDTLMSKNRSLLSSRAYAYRSDVSAHDALQYISRELRGAARMFIAEYDFSKYFDNISHEHVRRTLRDRGFLITGAEDEVISSFLAAPAMPLDSYVENGGEPRERGVPQGTSISLFLANVAAWDLDRALERLGVSFVRYADDTLIWSPEYGQICRAAETLHEMSERIGTPLNLRKSGGIRLLVRDGATSEIEATSHLDYLGHRVSTSALSVKPAMLEKIRSRVSKLIYFNLIREARLATQEPSRLSGVDRDYTTLVWQLRRYLYGDINERVLRRYETRGTPPRRFRGVMSFFPHVDDDEQLREFDRWMVCEVAKAVRRRGELLRALQLVPPVPYGLPRGALLRLMHPSRRTGALVDLRLPSIARVARVIRAAARRYGANLVARGARYDYE